MSILTQNEGFGQFHSSDEWVEAIGFDRPKKQSPADINFIQKFYKKSTVYIKKPLSKFE